MRRFWFDRLGAAFLAASLAAAGVALAAPADDPPAAGAKPADDKPGKPEAGVVVQPQWKPGDRWVVQCISPTQQSGDEVPAGKVRIDWNFTVEGNETIDDRECRKLKIETKTANGRVQPETTLWIDSKNYAVRQIQTQVPVAGEMRVVQEKFTHNQGTPSPVFLPINAIPLELPAFTEAGSKDVSFSYTAVQPNLAKSPEFVGFLYEVTQKSTVAPPALVKSVFPEALAKSAATVPTVLFEMTSGKRTIKQVWQKGQPWAVYGSNGRTESKLISYTPAP